MDCSICGSAIQGTESFCPVCGANLKEKKSEQAKETQVSASEQVKEEQNKQNNEQQQVIINNETVQQKQNNQKNGFAIASLVLGIVGIVGSCCCITGFIPAVVGVILGIFGLKSSKKEMAIIGIIISGIAILVSIVIFVFVLLSMSQYDESYYDGFMREFYDNIPYYQGYIKSVFNK